MTPERAIDFLTKEGQLPLGNHFYGVPTNEYRTDMNWQELHERAVVVFRMTEKGLVLEKDRRNRKK